MKNRILYVAAIFLVTLMLAELFLRLAPSSLQRPYRISYRNKLGIGQELIPNLHEKNWNTCFGAATYSTNQWGMRDRPRALVKTRPRIAILSDSFVEAEQVNDEVVLNRQLEGLYNNRVEVLNFAMGGIGTTHEVILYDTWVRQFKPDVVLLMFSLSNDISNNSYALENIAYKGHPFLVYRSLNGDLLNTQVISPKKQLRQWLLRYSALARLLKQVNSSLRYRPIVPNPISAATSTASEEAAQRYHTLRQEQYLFPPDAIWEDAWLVTEQELARLRDKVQADGAQFIVVVMPDEYELEDDTNFLVEGDMPTRALGRAVDLSYPRVRLIKLLEEQKIPVYDLASAMKQDALEHNLTKPFYSFPCDPHWTALGHQVAAELIFDYLQHRSSPPL